MKVLVVKPLVVSLEAGNREFPVCVGVRSEKNVPAGIIDIHIGPRHAFSIRIDDLPCS